MDFTPPSSTGVSPSLPRRLFSKKESNSEFRGLYQRSSSQHLTAFLDLGISPRGSINQIESSGIETPVLTNSMIINSPQTILDDFEDRYNRHSIQLFEKQPKEVQKIFDFPSNDIRVITATKEHLTDNAIRGNLTQEEISFLHPYLMDVLYFFQSPWITIQFTNRKYEPLLISPAESDVYEESSPHKSEKAFRKSESLTEISIQGPPKLKSSELPNHTTKAFKRYTKLPEDLFPQISSPVHRRDSLGANTIMPENSIDSAIEFLNNPNSYSEMSEMFTEKRSRLMQQYSNNWVWYNTSKLREQNDIKVFQSIPASILSVKINNIQFDQNPGQPVFFSLALFDIHSKKKLSENFYFDNLTLNSSAEKKMAKSAPPRIDPETRSLECWIKIPPKSQSDSLYLVLTAERVFQGEIGPTNELYHRGDKTKKALYSLEEIVTDACNRFGQYKQPFFWGAVPLFNQKDGILAQKTSTDFSVSELYLFPWFKDTSELCERIFDLRDGRFKKAKKIKGSITINVCLLSEVNDFPNRADPSLGLIREPEIKIQKIKTKREMQKERKNEPVQEIRRPSDTIFPEEEEKTSFDVTSPIVRTLNSFETPTNPIPFWSYVNLGYIYPLTADFRKFTGSKGNILLTVSVRDTDLIDSKPLKNMYGTSSCSRFTFEAQTSVHFKNEMPTWTDEIKFNIPAKLSEKHHLLFTFYNVGYTSKSSKKEPKNEFIGYCYLPLYPAKFINHGEKTLHVITSKLEKGYLSNLRPISSKSAPKFVFKFNVDSSLYPTDLNLNNFFQLIGSHYLEDDEKTQSALQGVLNADPNQSLQWFPIIISRLLYALLNYSKSIQMLVMGTFIRFLRKMRVFLNDSTSFRPEFFVRYLKYAFEAPKESKTPLSIALCNNYLAFKHRAQLGIQDSDKEIDKIELLEFSWFMFDLIIRSMILQLASNGNLGENSHRNKHFDIQSYFSVFQKVIMGISGLIKDVIVSKQNHLVAKKANMSVGFFIRDLFSIFDRGATHDLTNIYAQSLADQMLQIPDDHPAFRDLYQLRFDFLKIVTDHEHYIALCLPVPLKLEAGPEFLQKLATRSPLSSLLINAVVDALGRPEPHLRQLAISALNVLLTKHDFDRRLDNSACQERVAEMYFYILPLLVENNDKFRSWSVLNPSVGIHEKRSFYLCILFILKSTPVTTLQSWWKIEIRKAFFLDLLEDTIKAFQYDKQALNVNQERALTREANMIVIQTLYHFLLCFEKELSSPKSISLLDKIFNILVSLLERTQSRQTLKCIFFVLKNVVLKFENVMFCDKLGVQKKVDYATSLLFLLLPYTNYSDSQTRMLAASLIYFVIKGHWKIHGNIQDLKIKALIALNKNIIYNEYFRKSSYEKLEEALSLICQFSLSEYASPTLSQFDFVKPTEQYLGWNQYWKLRCTKSCQEFALTIVSIINNIRKVNILPDKEASAETLHELYYQIAKSHRECPELRVEWLNKLQQSHYMHKNYTEAAISNLFIVATLALPMVKANLLEESDLEIISQINPHVLQNTEEEYKPDDLDKQFTRSLETTIECFEKAQHYEFCISLCHIFIRIYERQTRYKKLSSVFNRISDLYSRIKNINTMDPQAQMPIYFRVGFYSKFLGEASGKEFIYKQSPETTLEEFCDRISKVQKAESGLTTEIVDATITPSIDSPTLVLQVSQVEPCYDEPPFTLNECATNITKFKLVTQYIKKFGLTTGTLAESATKQTLFTTETSFPSCRTVLKVISHTELDQSPLESAIEEVDKQVQKITEVQEKKSTRDLYTLLNGCLILKVNIKPFEYAEEFSKKASQYSDFHTSKLYQSLNRYLKALKEAISCHLQSCIEPDQVRINKSFSKSFKELKKGISTSLTYLKQYKSESMIKESKQEESGGNSED